MLHCTVQALKYVFVQVSVTNITFSESYMVNWNIVHLRGDKSNCGSNLVMKGVPLQTNKTWLKGSNSSLLT